VALPLRIPVERPLPFESVILESMNMHRYRQTLLTVSSCVGGRRMWVSSMMHLSFMHCEGGVHGVCTHILQLLVYRKSRIDEIHPLGIQELGLLSLSIGDCVPAYIWY